VNPDCHGITHSTNHHHSNLPDHTHTLRLIVVDGGKEVFFLGVATSPPGFDTSTMPQPDVEFWGSFKRM